MALTLADELELKGKKEGKAESIIMVLTSRFGEIPAALGKKIHSLREPGRIDKALVLAATCENLTEFKKEFTKAR